MTLLRKQEQETVAQAIRDVEATTNAELVTVLAAASDEYRYIPLLWASLIALLVPSALYFFVNTIEVVLWTQLLVVVVLGGIGQLGVFRARLIPRGVASWRAANMARRQFLELGLHHTDGETGVLVFVSEAERFVEILVDRGISSQVDDSKWESIVSQFIDDVHSGKIEQGFVRCLNSCGEILSTAVPKTPDNKNELDDRLVLIGYD